MRYLRTKDGPKPKCARRYGLGLKITGVEQDNIKISLLAIPILAPNGVTTIELSIKYVHKRKLRVNIIKIEVNISKRVKSSTVVVW